MLDPVLKNAMPVPTPFPFLARKPAHPSPGPCKEHEADDSKRPHVCFQSVGLGQHLWSG